MQSLALEGEFQVFKVALARPVVARIGFLGLLRRGMSAALAMADERFDVVGQAGEAMTLLEQEVTGRPGGV